MSIANYFNKLPKDAPLPISWKPSAERPTKRTKRGPGRPRKTSDSPLSVHVSSSSTATANWLCSFPDSLAVVAFSHTRGVRILRYTWYPRMTSDHS